MADDVTTHYSGEGRLIDRMLERLKGAGLDLDALTTADLAPVDEFHIRGRRATLEVAARMGLSDRSHVLDIGSGLGGPARTVAETCGCRVTGVDLTPAFCEAAEAFTALLGMGDRVDFRQADATALPFGDGEFDAAMTIHVGMNIEAKDRMYAEARRVLKPGAIFAVYDVLQGEGGEVHFPVPWARTPAISHLATPEAMRGLLAGAGFEVRSEDDSTEESQAWFEAMAAKFERDGPPPITFREFLGPDFIEMTRNQVRNLAERRIRTVTYICRA